MKPKQILIGDEARTKMIAGGRMVYEAVKATYSPQSGNVALEKTWGDPIVSHDGITVAREVVLTDPFENMGARFLIDASAKTNAMAGDGTSATVILGYHIWESAHRKIAAGFNPMAMRRGMKKAAADVDAWVKKQAVMIDDSKLHEVATVSAGDSATGKLIADTIVKVGRDGGINVEEHMGAGIEQDIVEGFYFNKGYDSPYFINDAEARQASYEDVHVLIANKKLRNVSDLKNVLELVAGQKHKNLLVIGYVSADALNLLIGNKMKGNVNSVSVAPPAYGQHNAQFLQDIATITGGRVISQSESGEDIDMAALGSAKKVVVKEGSTIIIGGEGAEEDVRMRVDALRESIKTEENKFTKENLEQRLAKLTGKIGVIRVGAATNMDRTELVFRVEDAVFATKAAQETGILPGGATALLHASNEIKPPKNLHEDEHAGYMAVMEALRMPFEQLMINAGVSDASYRSRAVVKAGFGHGYNVKSLTDEPISLMEEGVLDPAKVVLQAVENGSSVAGLAVTTNAGIVFDRNATTPQENLDD